MIAPGAWGHHCLSGETITLPLSTSCVACGRAPGQPEPADGAVADRAAASAPRLLAAAVHAGEATSIVLKELRQAAPTIDAVPLLLDAARLLLEANDLELAGDRDLRDFLRRWLRENTA